MLHCWILSIFVLYSVSPIYLHIPGCTARITWLLRDMSFLSGTEWTYATSCYRAPASRSPSRASSSQGYKHLSPFWLLIIQYYKYLPMILFSIIYVCTRWKNIYSQNYLQGRDATPYLERNRVGRDAIDAASALTDMGKYLFLERRLPVYDIAVAITKLDMCRYLSEQNNIETKKYFCGAKIFVRHRLSALATDKVDMLRWKYSYLLYSRFGPHCDCQIWYQ